MMPIFETLVSLADWDANENADGAAELENDLGIPHELILNRHCQQTKVYNMNVVCTFTLWMAILWNWAAGSSLVQSSSCSEKRKMFYFWTF